MYFHDCKYFHGRFLVEQTLYILTRLLGVVADATFTMHISTGQVDLILQISTVFDLMVTISWSVHKHLYSNYQESVCTPVTSPASVKQ